MIIKYEPKLDEQRILHVKWLINDLLYHNYKVYNRNFNFASGSNRLYYTTIENNFKEDDPENSVEIKVYRYDILNEQETLICYR